MTQRILWTAADRSLTVRQSTVFGDVAAVPAGRGHLLHCQQGAQALGIVLMFTARGAVVSAVGSPAYPGSALRDRASFFRGVF